ncbi:hypothetical protein B566_EDAN010372 [Ephemera danica]|nr:hypothetical protein B566_EDAN010372 [Ephemera danica]
MSPRKIIYRMEQAWNVNPAVDHSKKITFSSIGALGSTAVSALGNGWQSVCWLVGSVCLSVSLPCWLLGKLWFWQQRRNQQKLQNKVVLITGASSGLGEALAHAFYQSGCRVVLAARREAELKRVREELLQTHPTVPTHIPVVLPLDIGELNELPERVESILAIHGQIDIFVSNAGISCRCSAEDCAMDVDIKLMLINYLGHVAMTKAILPSMVRKRSGHIVAVSSVQGRIAIPHRSAYAASKHALQAFSDSLRAEVAPHNINVTVVSPGYINTNLSQNALTGTGQKYQVTDTTTAQGMPPHVVANRVVEAVIRGEQEVLVCSVTHRLAIILRTISPNIFFWLMQHRARSAANAS